MGLWYLRIKVDIVVNEPIPAGFFQNRNDGHNSWIQFKYERLFDFYYRYGALNNVTGQCLFEEPTTFSSIDRTVAKMYRPWLQAENQGSLLLINAKSKIEREILLVKERCVEEYCGSRYFLTKWYFDFIASIGILDDILNFPNSFSVEAKGLAGGLLLLWTDEIDLRCEKFLERLLKCIFHKTTGFKWSHFTCYRTPYRGEKKAFWDEFQQLILEEEKPWLVVGDLNEIFDET